MKPLVIGFALLALTSPTHFSAAQSRVSSTIKPGVAVSIAYQYYPVEGRSLKSVTNSLKSSGPRSGDSVFYATTTSQTGFTYVRAERGSYCKLENVGVNTDVIMLIPQWLHRDESSEVLRQAWDEFLDKLLTHEREHYRIVDESTRQLYHALTGMRADNCSMLDSEAKATIEEISKQQTDLNLRFDEETSHGMDDGAVWPPSGYRQNP